MGEFTARVQITPAVSEFTRGPALNSKLLPPLIESFWKPRDVDLRDFPPGQKTIRVRVAGDLSGSAVADELNTTLRDGNYTHDRIKLCEGTLAECEAFLQGKGYDKWTENHLRSIEYEIKLPDGGQVTVLEEEIDGKKTFIKFEAENGKDIEAVMQALGLTQKDLILKNRAELLAEQMGLL